MYNKDRIIKDANQYYKNKIETYGTTSRGVDWNSEESQMLRYIQLSKVFCEDTDKFSICDFGCGYGYYFKYLKEKKYDYSYEGIDLCKEMINEAKKLYHSEKECKFLNQSSITKDYDYIVSSGIFNVKQNEKNEQWTEYIIDTITQYNLWSKKGFAFNCLTKYSDEEYMRDDLYYGDPLYFFDYCKKNFSRNVDLLHGYNLYEFTIIVRK